MIGDIQFHNITAQLGYLVRLGFYLHTRFYSGGTGGGESTTAFDFHQTDAARTKRFKLVCRAQARDFNTRLGSSSHHRCALGYGDFNTINTQGNQLRASAFWRTKIGLRFVEFQHLNYLLYRYQ